MDGLGNAGEQAGKSGRLEWAPNTFTVPVNLILTVVK
jgi:hypothetical protein